ncbi:hypothetical protein [Dyadobacter sp. 3J3]|uniref:hypothetical protein n=1 Tax=Dyadobacter sp. 3J3 TaxID=2606600 RepID=UPI00135B4F20|nr:hypothetical protein [Dyadobacter sp. 3J3]
MNKTFYSLLICFTIILLFENVISAQSVEKRILQDSLKEKTNIGNAQNIYRHFNKYRIEGRNLRTPEILDRLSCVDSSDYKLYQKGRKDQKTGVAIALGGVGLFLIADVVAIGSAVNDIGNPNVNESSDDGTLIALFALGGGLVVGGFIKTILGKKIKNKAVTDYNQHISLRKKSVGFYVKPGLTGISLGLRF